MLAITDESVLISKEQKDAWALKTSTLSSRVRVITHFKPQLLDLSE
jgi:hypothetical protein